MKKYSDVIANIHLNIPIFSNAELWAERTNLNKALFPKMIRNVRDTINTLSSEIPISIVVNGFNLNSKQSFSMGKDFPKNMDLDPDKGENAQELKKAQELFPEIEIFPYTFIQSRAGSLDHIIDVKGDLKRKVVGCNDGPKLGGGRPFEWLHINPLGEVFTCCNDFQMESIIGDFKTQTLNELWGNDNHINGIISIYGGLCKSCIYAKFKN